MRLQAFAQRRQIAALRLTLQRAGQGGGIAEREQFANALHHLAATAAVGADHRHAGGHGLQQHHAEGLVIRAQGEQVEGLDGGFQFCRLSAEPLFTADGQIREDVTFAQLAEFVWFAETGTGFTGTADSPLLGVFDGQAIYLLYNGILKDHSVDGGNVLTGPVLDILPPFDGPKTIYAAACRLGAPRLQREQIVFKQTPYALAV